MTLLNLSALQDEEKAIIHNIQDSNCKFRLLELGFLPGKRIEILRKSPLGNTFFIKINENAFALRKKEATSILVQLI